LSARFELLPVTSIRDGEDPAQFARRVQVDAAEALGVIPTKFLYEQKVEMLKRSA